MEYKKYLQSAHWKDVKENYYSKKGKKCRICENSESLQLHHRQYKDKKGSILFKEKIYQLYGLCNSCHKTWHNFHGMKKMNISLIQRIKRLMKLGIVKNKAIQLCVYGDFCRNLLKGRGADYPSTHESGVANNAARYTHTQPNI